MQTSFSRIHLKMQRMARIGCAAKIREIRGLKEKVGKFNLWLARRLRGTRWSICLNHKWRSVRGWAWARLADGAGRNRPHWRRWASHRRRSCSRQQQLGTWWMFTALKFKVYSTFASWVNFKLWSPLREGLFRNPPSPLPKGVPPLPMSTLLRRGE